MTPSTSELIHRFPHLSHPLTYDAIEDLARRLRDELALVERTLDALRLDEIAALETRLAELKRQAAQMTPIVVREMEEARPPVVEVTPELACPHCERVFTNERALSGHIGRVHARQAKDVTPARAWQCATCDETDTTTRAASDATRCKACVRKTNDAQQATRPKAPALAS